MKTLKIIIILMIMLVLLFLPAMQVKMPVAEACKPSPSTDLTEPITAEEEQEIMNIIESSQLVSEAMQWLKEKEVTIDLSKHLIIKFSENITSIMPELNRYIIIILGTSSNTKHIGEIHITLDKNKNVCEIYAIRIKFSKTAFLAEIFNVKHQKTTYILDTGKLTYIYDGNSIRVQSDPTTCEDAGYYSSCSGDPTAIGGCTGSCPSGYSCEWTCLHYDQWCIVIMCGLCVVECIFGGPVVCALCLALQCGALPVYQCCDVKACCCVEPGEPRGTYP